MKRFNYEIFLTFVSFLYFLVIIFPHIPAYNRMFIDSGIYAYIGQQINKGKILYKEIWDYKLPGIYYVYAFLFKIFPDSRWTLYFFDVFTNVFVLFIIFKILKIFKLQSYFWIFVFLFTTTYRIYPCFSGGNLTEHIFIFLSIPLIYLLLEKPSKIYDFLSGILFCYLLMLKQPYFLIVLVIFLYFKDRILKGEKKFFILGFLICFSFFLYVLLRGFPDSIDVIKIPYKLGVQTNQDRKNFISYILYRFKIMMETGPGIPIFMLLLPVLFTKDKMKFLFLYLLIALFFIYFITFALYTHYILLLNIPFLIGCFIIAKNYPKKIVIPFLIVCFLLPYPLIKRRFYHSYNAFRKFFILKDRRIKVHPAVFPVFKYVKRGETLFIPSSIGEVHFITKIESPWKFTGSGSGVPTEELRKLIREKPPDYVYLDIPVEEFEKIFSLNKNEYKLTHLENNLYKFEIVKSLHNQ